MTLAVIGVRFAACLVRRSVRAELLNCAGTCEHAQLECLAYVQPGGEAGT